MKKGKNILLPQTHNEVVFAAMSKKSFFLREYIVRYILENNYAPSCAFMMFSYFLLDTTQREGLINATNALITKSDQLWVFGPISDGVVYEINLAKSLNIEVKYFDIVLKDVVGFKQIAESKIKFEDKKAKLKFQLTGSGSDSHT